MRSPILLNSCARAATSAEMPFRTGPGPSQPRSALVVALDPGALAIAMSLSGADFPHAEVLTVGDSSLQLRTLAGEPADLAVDLVGRDFALMIATAGTGARVAASIGQLCADYAITAIGVVVQGAEPSRATVNALRPYVRVLLVSSDDRDAAELLSAVGG